MLPGDSQCEMLEEYR